MSIVTVTKENFQKEVMESDKVVLLDFWAAWCGPCRMLGPVLEEIAAASSEYKICKINVDEQSELATQFQVMSIPLVAVMKNGTVHSTAVGFKPKEYIEKMLKV